MSHLKPPRFLGKTPSNWSTPAARLPHGCEKFNIGFIPKTPLSQRFWDNSPLLTYNFTLVAFDECKFWGRNFWDCWRGGALTLVGVTEIWCEFSGFWCVFPPQRKSSKAKEKKQRRLEERAAMAAVCAKVEAANKVSVENKKNGRKNPRIGENPATAPLALGRSLVSSSSKIPSKPSRCSRSTTGTGECRCSRCPRGRSRCPRGRSWCSQGL